MRRSVPSLGLLLAIKYAAFSPPFCACATGTAMRADRCPSTNIATRPVEYSNILVFMTASWFARTRSHPASVPRLVSGC